ncbi:hypothetical protein ACPX19_01575 [Winogradskyella sp. HB-48]|uniref:hypothetical protein n=1 Tax=Winogradskyella sp. HB-48 TaxID=3416808 RepID=UPI003CEA28DB
MKYLKLIICLLFTAYAFGQESQGVKTIEPDEELIAKTESFFKMYFSQIKDHKWAELIENMPKEYLDFAGKKTLTSQIEKAFNNEAFSTTFNEMTFKNISKAFVFKDVTYAEVNYYNSFTFNFNKTEKQSEKDFNIYMDFMASTFSNQFKNQNVKREGNGITISGDKVIVVIDNPKNDSLKMLEIEKNMAEMYKMFMPGEVVNKLVE